MTMDKSLKVRLGLARDERVEPRRADPAAQDGRPLAGGR